MICVCRPLVWCINSFACLLLYSRWLCTLESWLSLSNLQNKMLMCTLLCGGHMAVVLLCKELHQSLLYCRVATSCFIGFLHPGDAKDLLRECCLLWTVQCAVGGGLSILISAMVVGYYKCVIFESILWGNTHGQELLKVAWETFTFIIFWPETGWPRVSPPCLKSVVLLSSNVTWRTW